MKAILQEQWNRYPGMLPEDVVKLLYQSEFGGGHMISDPQESLERLVEEWRGRAGSQTGADGRNWERIGGGMCRMHLSVLDQGLSPETLNRMFVRSAKQKKGEQASFERKLALLCQLCRNGGLPLDADVLEGYLDSYRRQGYPAVSHSHEYRRRYHPAYRVVSQRFARYYEVFRQIDRVLESSGQKQVVVAVDGMCGSGKTTLGAILQEIYDCNLFHMDDFFLQPGQRTRERLEEPGGNVDYERFRAQVLEHLKDPEGCCYQIYDCSIRQLDRKVQTGYRRLNIVEGAYSQHPYFGDIYDLRFFCGVPEEEQMARIRARNGEELLRRFRSEWIPMENKYFAAFGIREKSLYVEGGTPQNQE